MYRKRNFLSVQELHGVHDDQLLSLQSMGDGLFTALALLVAAPLLSAVVDGLLDAFTVVLKLKNRCSVHKPRSKLINILILKMSS